MEEIGTWLKHRRQTMNLSIREFGKKSGVSYTTIAQIEKGIKPSVNVIKKLAFFLKVDETYLLNLAGIIELKKKVANAIAQETDGLPQYIQEDILEYAKFKKRQYEEGKSRKP